MPKIPKIHIYLIIAVIVIGFIKWGHTQVWEQGYNAHKSEISDIKDDAVKEDKADVKTIIKYRDREKVVYRDKIKYIDSVKDTTGCADTKLTDMGFGLQ
jgi:hypothetical protein